MDFKTFGLRSMNDLSEHMQASIDYLSKAENKYANLVPFVIAYLYVTGGISDAIARGDRIKNALEIIKLDLAVAEDFYSALDRYVNYSRSSYPWDVYYKSCAQNCTAFSTLMVGVYIHIMYSFTVCLAELNIESKDDYDKIDLIIVGRLKLIMSSLHKQYGEKMFLIMSIITPITKLLFKVIVNRWIDATWQNAQFLKKLNDRQKEQAIYEYANKISNNALIINNLSNNLNPIRLLLLIFRLNRLNHFLD